MYERYEALAAERGVSSYEVAKATGISSSTLYDWKAGRSKPKVEKLIKLAEYFNVPVTYFLEA